MKKIGKGIDYSNAVTALCCLVFSAFLFYLGIVHNYTLRIKSFVLPHWSIYVLGFIAAGIGILLFVQSLKSNKCLDCNKVLEPGEVKVKFKWKEAVVEALNKLDAASLRQVPIEKESGDSIMISIDYCPYCMNVAEIEAVASINWNDETLIKKKEVSGNGVKQLVDYIQEFGELNE